MPDALAIPRADFVEAGASKAAERVTARARDTDRAFSTVEIHRSIAPVEGVWTELLRDGLATPYQTPAFLGAWLEHAARHEGVEPLICVARDAGGSAVAVLPLGVRRRWGVRVAGFLGGSHVNYNMPVIRRDQLDRFAGDEPTRLLGEAARAAKVDAFALYRQPLIWDGVANPFATLPRQPSPDAGYCGPLAPSLEDHLKLFVSAKSRSNQRRKMRRFEERGAPRIYRAETLVERTRLLDAYFDQKERQFAARGVANVFKRPGVYEFLADACGLAGRPAAVDLYGFDLDDEVIAVTGGLSDGKRYCGMIISITSGEHAKYSPGEMLMNFVVEDSIRRGHSVFDLGVGAAVYKKMYCPDAEPLFDSIFGVTAKGRAAAAGVAAVAGAKAKVKGAPRVYGMLNRIRRTIARRDGSQGGPAVID